MRSRGKIAFEPLESRQLFSGSPLGRILASSAASAPPPIVASSPPAPAIVQSTAPSGVTPLTAQNVLAGQPSLASVSLASSVANRWNWLAGTSWFVPPQNLLAYLAPGNLSNPQPIGDQTLWNITQSSGGHISGNSVVKFSSSSEPTQSTFTGIITSGGQVRMEFTTGGSDGTTTGIGQMRFLDGAWRVEMQMATGAGFIITHWAYMSQLPPGGVTPDPGDVSTSEGLLSNEWRWMEGTNWAITDTALFGGGAHTGVFTISAYRNGYFWGSGQGAQPFNVLGSVTPEGNVLFIVSVGGAAPVTRTGVLRQTSPAGGVMTLRTYEGTPAVGQAWTLLNPALPVSGRRAFLASYVPTQ